MGLLICYLWSLEKGKQVDRERVVSPSSKDVCVSCQSNEQSGNRQGLNHFARSPRKKTDSQGSPVIPLRPSLEGLWEIGQQISHQGVLQWGALPANPWAVKASIWAPPKCKVSNDQSALA